MGCTDPVRRGVGAPHQCPLGSVASYLQLIYADVRLHIPMTSHSGYGNISPETFCDVVDKQRADVSAISQKVLQDFADDQQLVPPDIAALRLNLASVNNKE